MDDNKEYNVLKEISIIGDEIRILTGLSKILEELANNDNGSLLFAFLQNSGAGRTIRFIE